MGADVAPGVTLRKLVGPICQLIVVALHEALGTAVAVVSLGVPAPRRENAVFAGPIIPVVQLQVPAGMFITSPSTTL